MNITFVKSAASPDGFVRDGLPQLVFVGRSNVGKSSVLNCVSGGGKPARVSSMPGKTAHVNYFLIDKPKSLLAQAGTADSPFYIADLPGYGYAKVSGAEKARWAALMEAYFASGLISRGFQIVDARHKPTADDITMFDWFRQSNVAVSVIANKIDKCKKSEIDGKLQQIALTLGCAVADILPFSAVTGYNRNELLRLIFNGK